MEQKNSFLLKLPHEKIMGILDRLDAEETPYYLITEWGAVGNQEKSKYVIELGETSDDNYIGTMDMLETSEDKVIVRLKKKDYTEKLPNVRDLFKFKTFGGKDDNRTRKTRHT